MFRDTKEIPVGWELIDGEWKPKQWKYDYEHTYPESRGWYIRHAARTRPRRLAFWWVLAMSVQRPIRLHAYLSRKFQQTFERAATKSIREG